MEIETRSNLGVEPRWRDRKYQDWGGGPGGSGEGLLGGLEQPAGEGWEKEVGVANSLGPPSCLCSWTSSMGTCESPGYM